LACGAVLWPGGGHTRADGGADPAKAVPEAGPAREAAALDVLDNYCVQCHGPEQQKGGVRFDALETIDTVVQEEMFLNARDAVHFEEMPPAKAKQPTPDERAVLLAWLKDKLTGEAADKLAEKLRRPDAGNYVDHDDLFSGEYAGLPGYTHDRRWLISEYIFDAKFNRILDYTPHRDIDGKRHRVVGDNNRRGINLTNPFLLSNDAGVRYYANETLNGGHLLTMLTNAKEAGDYMMYLADRNKRYLPAVNDIMALEDQNRETLERRERFLEQHIDRVLQDLYKGEHERLLPKFVRADVPEPIPNDGSVKKAPFHAANPGRDELVTIFRSMRRLEKPGMSDAQLIEACEREWFYHGHDQRKIEARVTFLHNYMPEWRKQIEQHKYDERNRVIAYRPLGDDEMQVVTQTIRKHREAGDNYRQIIDKCVEQWATEFERQRIAAGPPSPEQLGTLIRELTLLILEREPTEQEAQKYAEVARAYARSLSRRDTIKKLISTVMLNTDFVYRQEFGVGEADAHGRRMMSPRDLSYAIAYALTDSSPDAELAKAAKEGRLTTRADVEREVRRMLEKRDQYTIIDDSVDTKDVPNFTNMPIRELRFFRDFFGYDKMLGIFKDNKRFGGNYDNLKTRVVAEADMLVEHIVESDQDVFKKLLTTDKFYVFHSGDNQDMQVASDRIKKIYNYFKDKNWRDFTIEDLRKHRDFIAETQMRGIDANRLDGPDRRYNPMSAFMRQMESFELRLGKGQADAAGYPSFPSHGFNGAWNRYDGRMQGPEVARMFNIDLTDWDYPTQQPAKLQNRKGILTHPAWLISFAANTETDPIHRGIWVQEKLLAGTIPDVPITVDAVIPENPHKTLRQRLDDKTNNDYCMRCHVKINPLGIPFEIYDDFGRYRTEERLEYPENLIEKVKDKGEPHEDLRDIYKTLPVNAEGYLEGTGDSALDGEVDDALDLIDRLAQSERVRQSIIRHAFRYFLGRNETLNDSKTLIDADRAYVASGGSFDEVIVALLTSDSFLYRKAPEKKD
jgi:mono/diheme cytochrome c family protein